MSEWEWLTQVPLAVAIGLILCTYSKKTYETDGEATTCIRERPIKNSKDLAVGEGWIQNFIHGKGI